MHPGHRMQGPTYSAQLVREHIERTNDYEQLGQRVGDGIGISADDVKHLKPLATQGWGPEEQNRLDNLGHNGPRDVEGLTMTHCVPNEHVAVAEGNREFVGAS